MDLRLTGKPLVATETGHQVELDFADDYSLSIESRFSINKGGVTTELFPDDTFERISALLRSLIGLVVTRAEATEAGELQVDLTDGSSIAAKPFSPRSFEVRRQPPCHRSRRPRTADGSTEQPG